MLFFKPCKLVDKGS